MTTIRLGIELFVFLFFKNINQQTIVGHSLLMKKSLAVGLFVACAFTAFLVYHFKVAPNNASANNAPAAAQQTSQVATIAPAEPTVASSEAAPVVAADSTPTNNGLTTLSLNTEFSAAKPSPEAAKNALAMNTWMQQRSKQQ